jgi:hypothetical protein
VTTAIVQLVLLGEARELQVVEDDPILAPLSEKPLRRIQFDLRVANGSEHESLQAELAGSPNDPAIVAGSDGIQWEVTSHSYSYSGSIPPVHHIELAERAQLNLDRVEFGGLAIIPERWSLEGGDSPTLTLSAELSSAENQRFETVLEQCAEGEVADSYFPVTLTGIVDHPIKMRFGKCLWQDLGGGSAKHRIVLVADEGDEPSQSVPGLEQLFQPGMNRIMEGTLRSRRRLDALINELRRAGVLDDETVSRIDSAADVLPFSDAREFDRARNVDDFF